MIVCVNSENLLNSTDKLILEILKNYFFFAVKTEFLNIIQASFGIKGLVWEVSYRLMRSFFFQHKIIYITH